MSTSQHNSRTYKNYQYKQLVNLGQTWQESIAELRQQSTLNKKWLDCVCDHQTKATLVCQPLNIWCASSEDCQVYQCRLGEYVSKKNEGKGGEIGGRIRETQNAGRRDRERVRKGERIREGQREER